MSDDRVCLIEDDRLVQRSVAQLLRFHDIEPLLFASAEDFLDSKPSEAVVMVIDLGLPGMSGADLIQHLYDSGCHWPVILTSGDCDPKVVASLEAYADIVVLGKPYRTSELIDQINRALQRLA